jgi:hypothetical protein
MLTSDAGAIHRALATGRCTFDGVILAGSIAADASNSHHLD